MIKQIRQLSLRALAFLLAFAIIVSMVPLSHASEEEKFTENGLGYRLTEDKNGNPCVKITRYTGTASELTIPSELQGLPVDSIENYAFDDCSLLTSVIIPDSVTDIGYGTFYNCTNLVRVVLPEGITTINGSVFFGCSSLASISIPESVTSIEYDAFADCSSLTTIRIPKNVTSIGNNVFLGCSSLSEILVDAENEAFSVRDGMLYNKDQTTLIWVPSTLSGSFTVPDHVTTIGVGAFRELPGLTGVIIPDTVTSIESWAFYGCTSLKDVVLPQAITRIAERAFSSCEALTQIQIPGNVEYIDDYAFCYCPNLTSIEIPTSVKKIGTYAFANCYAMQSITFLGPAPTIHRDAFSRVKAVCYYSPGYEGWTESTLINYSGELVWSPSEDIHVHDYNVVITPPTCLEWGYSTYTCACGYSYVGDETFFTGHSMGEWTVHREATCTQRGEERSTCANCSYYESRLIEMVEHSFADGICRVCGCDAASAIQIVDVTSYSYTVTPILSPFAYYLYVQTDNPDPRSFRLVDRESAYYDSEAKSEIRVPTSHGYSYKEVDPGTYYIAQSLFPDVVYEDQSIYRVPGGYIFLAHNAYSDGGEFVLLQQTVVGDSILGDTFRDTDVVIPCRKLYTYLPYLLEHCTDPELSLFENLNRVNAFLADYAVYPRSVYNADKPNDDRHYPFLCSAYWPELPLDARYTIFEPLEDGLLMMAAYPFVLDSLGYPGTIGAIARTLAPDCIVDSTSLHYEVQITCNGETRTYGGAGSGGNDPLYSNQVDKTFTFSGGADCATSGTLDSYCQTLLSFEAVAIEGNARYADLVSGETFLNTIKRSGSTWAQVATEGGFGYGTSFAYLLWDGDSVRAPSDVWVDGRYIGVREIVEIHTTFEEHPTAGILLHDVTYTDYYGVTNTCDVLYRYDEDLDVWTSYDAYTGGWSTSGMVLPEELILTQEEVAAMDLDSNSSLWPTSGLIYDGTANPGTPFTHTSVTGVTLTESVTLYEGEEITLELQVFPADADDPRVKWTVSDETIVEIVNSAECLIRGLAEGTTQITVTTIDGGYSAVCQVTVKDACENGHSFTNYVSDNNATCTEDGTKTAVCDRCDAISTYPDEGSALGHQFYNVTVHKAATCTEEGLESGTCWRCQQVCEQVIPATGHNPYTLSAQEATCTEAGKTEGEACWTCGTVLTEQTEIPALGHELGEWYVTKQATCQRGGREQRDCTRCHHTETREIPATGHDYEVEETPPTCTEKGIRLKVCRSCGSEVMEYIPATGHNYEKTVTAPTCTEGGYTTHTCRCGDSYVADEVPALGHEFVDSVCIHCGEIRKNNPFVDVPEDQWYTDPVLWAVEKGITSGTSTTTFSPEETCTRAQVVTFLWRAFGQPAPEQTDNPFTDVEPADYYYSAVLWAVEQGVTAGTSPTTFSPNDPCTRNQVVTFLWRAMGKPEPKQDDNPFVDVPENAYFYQSVLWAVENSITAGTGVGKFSPDDSCTRSQVVTFLYRALKDK